MDNAKLLVSATSNDIIPVRKYLLKSGLTVVLAATEGPLVSGFFCILTEAHDDDGLPHTLEHLVFMGSEAYPYKGILDLLANRCLASGTNAWTDTDHTCYTMTTAGSEGFISLLPVYLDHVLFPKLTEAAYLTEVHHINGEGEDAGVVYCEMQGCENTGEGLVKRTMLRLMYPEGCGYRYETGGIMENLRSSTSHEKVCNYHKQFYRPENVCLIICGQVAAEDVFNCLSDFELNASMRCKMDNAYKKPWQDPVAPLTASVEVQVPFPSDDEDHGLVDMSWRGPLGKDHYTFVAITVLLEYLTDSSIAPLQREFVEQDEPLCSKVRYSLHENYECCLTLEFQNVPVNQLNAIKDKLLSVLRAQVDGREVIDMTRMHNVISRKKLQLLSTQENNPNDAVANYIIGDILYGCSDEDTNERLNGAHTLDKLNNEQQEFWMGIVQKYFLDAYHVLVIGQPSKQLMEQMGEAEKQRVQSQRDALGDDGLKLLSDRLDEAMEQNETPVPPHIISSVPAPGLHSISFHEIAVRDNWALYDATKKDGGCQSLANVPVPLLLADCHSNFVTLTAVMDTQTVSASLRPHLALLLELLLESPILKDGNLIAHTKVIADLNADTIHTNVSLGVHGKRFAVSLLGELAFLEIQVERSKYERGVQWLHDLLYLSHMTPDRVKIVGTKMLKDVARLKRKGAMVTQMLLKHLVLKPESNHIMASMIRQQTFLTELLARLDNESTAADVVAELDLARRELLAPGNVRFQLTVDMNKLAELHPSSLTAWNILPAASEKDRNRRLPLKLTSSYLRTFANTPTPRCAIVGLGAIETSYLLAAVPTLSDISHADLPALRVAMQYFIQVEGPMWREIRGMGLAYHYKLIVVPEQGLLYFVLHLATHVVQAYAQAKQIVSRYLSGEVPLSDVELVSAKGSLVYEIVGEEKTPGSAAMQALIHSLLDVNVSFSRKFIEDVSAVTMADVLRVGAQYIQPLFDASQCRMAVCCHPSKVTEIVDEFHQMDIELTTVDSLDNFVQL